MQIEKIHVKLVKGTRDYLKQAGFTRALVGISGGIDSATVTALAVEALGKENVLGVFMPGPHTTDESTECALELAGNLDIELKEIPITDLYEIFLETLEPIFKGRPKDVTEENLQARIRGNILMALSNKFGYFVLNTGNKSEAMVGYCTLYGDSVGGLAVLGNVYKTQVYGLARFINTGKEIIPTKIINRKPSAELSKNQLDSDDLPEYDILDKMLHEISHGKTAIELVKGGFNKKDVDIVIERIKKNSFKKLQCPPGIKL